MTDPARSSKDVSLYQVAGLILGVVALKSAFILSSLPSMWVWADESLYYMTAHDLVHPERAAILVVGPAEAILPQLESLGAVEVVQP